MFPPGLRFVALLLVACSAIVGTTATAQTTNPVFNGAFGRDLRGWIMEGVPVAWSDRDANSLTDSGSALVVNNGPPMNGQGIYQCLWGVTFTAGTTLDIGAKINLPAGQGNTGWAAVGINWYRQPGCQDSHDLSGPRADVSTPNADFAWTTTTFTVPDGAVSAELVVYVTRMEANGSLLAYFDDIFVKPSGSPIPRTPIYVPAAAHVFGAAETAWRTDLVIHNPTPADINANVLDLLERGRSNTSPQRGIFAVPAGSSASYADALATWFSHDGAAALRVVPASPNLVVGSRTYNVTAQGTYGQFIPGVPEDEATVYGQTARLLQLKQTVATETGFRTNIGFVSAVGMPIQVDVKMFTADGSVLGTRSYPLPEFGFMQIDRILAEVSGVDIVNGYALLTTPTPGGRFIAYASVIDNATGDAIFVQPARL